MDTFLIFVAFGFSGKLPNYSLSHMAEDFNT